MMRKLLGSWAKFNAKNRFRSSYGEPAFELGGEINSLVNTSWDEYHRQLFSFLRSSAPGELLAPEYLCGPISELIPSANVQPYFSETALGSVLPHLTIVHKGQMGRLSLRHLRKCSFSETVVFANEVFVVFDARLAETERQSRQTDHSKPVYDYAFRDVVVPASCRPRSAAIVSAFGVGNIGDDAVTLGVEFLLRQSGFTDVRKLGPNPEYSEMDFADLVVVGGGGLFYDSDFENVSNYTAPIRYAKERGKLAAFIGIGTQGITTQIGAEAYRAALQFADLVTVRDVVDSRILSESVGFHRAMSTTDTAFSLNSAILQDVGSNNTRDLAIFSLGTTSEGWLRDNGIGFVDLSIAAVKELQSKYRKVLLLCHSKDDTEAYKNISSAVHIDPIALCDLGVETTIQIYASADLVFTSRFHGVIFGAMGRAPLVVLSTPEGKTGRLIKSSLQSLLPSTVFSDSVSPARILTMLDRPSIVGDDEVQRLHNEAQRNRWAIEELVQRHVPAAQSRGQQTVDQAGAAADARAITGRMPSDQEREPDSRNNHPDENVPRSRQRPAAVLRPEILATFMASGDSAMAVGSELNSEELQKLTATLGPAGELKVIGRNDLKLGSTGTTGNSITFLKSALALSRNSRKPDTAKLLVYGAQPEDLSVIVGHLRYKTGNVLWIITEIPEGGIPSVLEAIALNDWEISTRKGKSWSPCPIHESDRIENFPLILKRVPHESA